MHAKKFINYNHIVLIIKQKRFFYLSFLWDVMDAVRS